MAKKPGRKGKHTRRSNRPAVTPAAPASSSRAPAESGDAVPSAGASIDRLGIARACVEAWRLERRLRSSDDARLSEAAKRLLEALESAGCRLEDPAGSPFIDGAVMEVIGDVPSAPSLRVAETIRPAVFIAGQLELPAQVLVTVEGN